MKDDILQKLPVVGIGASAGGIRALQQLFDALPAKVGAAFVVIVHLDPYHSSELSRILAGHTEMKVLPVHGLMPLEADTVYVIPPDRQLTITDEHISEASFQAPRGLRAPIDMFLRSLAENHGDGFAVILSGGGTDGTLGVQSIREKGGVILVQDPAEAEFASMPRSAIASGVDYVLPVTELAARLASLIELRKRLYVETKGGDDSKALQEILEQLKLKTGQDFAQYKRSTIMRRIIRRMQVAGVDSLDAYSSYLREHADEPHALFNDLLISVTNFFRDPAAFRTLADLVIPKLFDKASSEAGIRVWVPACATGQEAYTIAILLLDEAARRKQLIDIQVFASDLDADALAIAREGRYPAAISADVNEEHLKQYFIREDDTYRVRREVRDRVVFALHSIIKDPPFSRVDLITCRNFLIYLDREVQQQTCAIFHYALRPGGFLFLGSSENADNPAGLFTLVDRDARIYRATERAREKLPPILLGAWSGRLPYSSNAPHRSQALLPPDGASHARALETRAPPSMLVDEAHHVVNLSETAGRYILMPKGPPTSDAAEIVRPELRFELQAALRTAFDEDERTLTLPIPVRLDGALRSIILEVSPVQQDGSARAALVLFLEGAPIPSAEARSITAVSEPSLQRLQMELTTTRDVLRGTREKYEVAIEDLRAANEELQSINEEYRSTAEELETSREELQSINEELQVVNQELKLKLDMVSTAHSDLQNLITATDVGTLFLDTALRIKLITPRILDVINVTNGDEGRSITDFTHRLAYADIATDARRVLTELVPIEHTVPAAGDRWFLVRLRPYRTVEDRVAGVVLTFVDITERRRSDEAWHARQTMLVRELSHRVKNTLAVVQAITRFTLNESQVDRETCEILEDRLQGLARSHGLLVRTDWKGASLDTLAREQLAPYVDHTDRLHMDGMAFILPPELATPVGLVLHELATNAAKHGAWSEPNGTVQLDWKRRQTGDGQSWIDITWNEKGSKPANLERKSAGLTLIEHCITGCEVSLKSTPTGLVCTLSVPLWNPATHSA